MTTNEMVLVTGGSGFLGVHVLLQVLQKGYQAQTTVRSLKRVDEVRQMLRHGGATPAQADSVKFFTADLSKDEGWTEACQGCSYVMHVASPFPAAKPKNEDDLIIPAREGTLRVLRAAKAAGTVKRVVVTSSNAAISYGHNAHEKAFTEEDWTNLENPSRPVAPYQKSKTIAERAAWDWIKAEGGSMELSVVNPVAIFGPLLGKDFSTSIEIIVRLLNGSLPAVPQIAFGAVDVRDCADLHLRAMTDPKAAGQRYISCSDDEYVYMKDIAKMLKEGLTAEESKKVPTRVMPDILLRFAGLFSPTIGLVTTELGNLKKASNAKAKSELGWTTRSTEEGVIASAKSVMEFGLVK